MTYDSPSAAYAPTHGGYPGTIEDEQESKSSKVHGYVVHPDGKAEHVQIDGDLDTLQGIVGGDIEYVFVTYGVHAYVNENGKFDPACKPNHLATMLAGLAGVDIIMGTAIFLGDGPEGEEGDLPAEWASL